MAETTRNKILNEAVRCAMNISEMIESLSEHGNRADRLEDMLDRYSAHGIIELTQEQVEKFFKEVFICETTRPKTNIGSTA